MNTNKKPTRGADKQPRKPRSVVGVNQKKDTVVKKAETPVKKRVAAKTADKKADKGKTTQTGKAAQQKARQTGKVEVVAYSPISNKIQHPKKIAMIMALRQSLGVISVACDAAQINRSTHYEWLNNDPDYKAEVEAVSDLALDFVETSLFKQIKSENTAATIFYLKTKGKKRGFVETQININKEAAELDDLTDDELEILANEGYAGYKKVLDTRDELKRSQDGGE